MLQATNILCYDNSIQSETLRDACMIAVLVSMTMVLCLIDMYLQTTRRAQGDQQHIIASSTNEEPFNHYTKSMEACFQELMG